VKVNILSGSQLKPLISYWSGCVTDRHTLVYGSV